jgi:hypothetical protein
MQNVDARLNQVTAEQFEKRIELHVAPEQRFLGGDVLVRGHAPNLPMQMKKKRPERGVRAARERA